MSEFETPAQEPTQGAKASLEKLPTEILLAIFDIANPSYSRHTLPSLCLVNQRLGGIARDLLYRDILLRSSSSWSDTLIPKLLRTLNERPDLGKLTRRLMLLLSGQDVYYDLNDYIRMPTQARSVFVPHWRSINEVELAGSMLTLLPNLDSLNFTVADEARLEDEVDIHEGHLAAEDPFYHLVGVSGHNLADGLLKIPGLRSLRALTFEAEIFHWAWLCLPIQELCLGNRARIVLPDQKSGNTDSCASFDSCPTLLSLALSCWPSVFLTEESFYNPLTQMLERCPNVKDLELDIYDVGRQTRPTASQRGSMDVLLGLVACTAARLQTLKMYPSYPWYTNQEIWQYISPPTKLDHFTALTSLYIPQAAFLGANYGNGVPISPTPHLLPDTLRYLCIYESTVTIVKWLETLLNLKIKKLNLGVIEVECDRMDRETYERLLYTEHRTPIWKDLGVIGIEARFYLAGLWNADWDDPDYDPLSVDILKFWGSVPEW